MLDLGKLRYDFDLDIDEVPIHYLYHYLQDYLDVSDFSGVLNVDLQANGSIETYQDVQLHGNIAIDDMYLIDPDQDTAFALGRGPCRYPRDRP